MGRDHVGLEHYVYLAQGTMTPGEMLQRMHRHLLDGCETCRRHWESLLESERADVRRLLAEEDDPAAVDPATPPLAPPGKPSAYETAFSGAAARVTESAERLRREKRRAKKDLDALLAIPPDRRGGAILRSKGRFHSPALAHLLVEEARERVRRSPREAQELLDLVHPILLWTPGAIGSGWARALQVRVEAHRANALRVAGDLPEADRRFRALRRELRLEPLADAGVEAELASLEASLRWGQRRFPDAAELLDRAVVTCEELGEREGLARALLQRAGVQQNLERPLDALADLQRARELIDPRRQEFLFLFTAAGTVPVLLDLGRFDEAEAVLGEVERCPTAAERWWRLRLLHLRGRAALGRGDLDRAEHLLSEARQAFLDQELPSDAANAALDLALVHLHQGRTGQVRALCREIAALLAALGVERDALAAVALLGKACRADAAALAQVALLRRELQAPPRRRAAEPS